VNMREAAKHQDDLAIWLHGREGSNQLKGALEEVINIHRPFFRGSMEDAECANCTPITTYPCRELQIIHQWLVP
jgi:hypothetical protein